MMLFHHIYIFTVIIVICHHMSSYVSSSSSSSVIIFPHHHNHNHMQGEQWKRECPVCALSSPSIHCHHHHLSSYAIICHHHHHHHHYHLSAYVMTIFVIIMYEEGPWKRESAPCLESLPFPLPPYSFSIIIICHHISSS